MWRQHNENPLGRNVGDCTVRAIATATGLTWDTAYLWLCVYGFAMKDMPSANAVWGAFLKARGFTRHFIPDQCPDCYTVEDFCRDHPEGTFVLALSTHVLTVIDGEFYDTWPSGQELPTYYWTKEETP